jgi:hypothetical protein
LRNSTCKWWNLLVRGTIPINKTHRRAPQAMGDKKGLTGFQKAYCSKCHRYLRKFILLFYH